VEHLARVLEAERVEVDEEVVLVRQRQPDLGDPRLPVDHRRAHREERLLQRQAVVARVDLGQGGQHRVERGAPVGLQVGLPPLGGDLGGHHAVVRGLQGGVAVGVEGVELRVGRLQHDEPAHARGHPCPPVLPRDGGRADVGPTPGERVRVAGEGIPRVALDRDAGAPHLRDVLGEVPGEREPERLRLAHRVAGLLGVGVDGR
jgi:hypothetical protein